MTVMPKLRLRMPSNQYTLSSFWFFHSSMCASTLAYPNCKERKGNQYILQVTHTHKEKSVFNLWFVILNRMNMSKKIFIFCRFTSFLLSSEFFFRYFKRKTSIHIWATKIKFRPRFGQSVVGARMLNVLCCCFLCILKLSHIIIEDCP